MSRRRVLIIGGGAAGLTTAYELSRTPELRARWQVEVVEMGHRYGGRLASAHNPEAGGRNEEHGLHVWFGWYDNVFRMADEIWRDAPRDPACPWQTVWDALRPTHASDHGLLEEGRLVVRRAHHARNYDRPGEQIERSWTGRLTNLLDLLRSLPQSVRSVAGAPSGSRAKPAKRSGWLGQALWPTPDDLHSLDEIEPVLHAIATQVAKLAVPTSTRGRIEMGRVLELGLRTPHRLLHRRLSRSCETGGNPGALALLRALDVGLAIARGVASPRHEIMTDGDFDRISHLEFREWLGMHGALPDTLAHSRLLDCLYDIPFAFFGGDRAQPVLEAGTALRFTYRILAGYKHAIAYQLSAGAGETLIAPLYALLRERGVMFRPFHRLQSMDVGTGIREVEGLSFVRSARVRQDYDPLFMRRGLLSFRAAPDWTQIVDGERLAARGVDFYSRFGDQGERELVELRRGKDFDDVVLALPLGCIKKDGDGHSSVQGWIDKHPPAARCLERLHLVPTVAAQVWLDEDSEHTGLANKSIVSWGQPYSVLCDMSPVIEHEDWGANGPRSCAYMCGAWDLQAHRAPSSDPDALRRDLERARTAFRMQLGRDWSSLSDNRPNVFSFPAHTEAPAGEYVRANVQPWDLADLSLPGADAVRLDAADTGLSNLALAGSWVRTPVNSTSIEAAVASGIAAARALGVRTPEILGENLFRRPSCHPYLPGRDADWFPMPRPQEPSARRRTA